ncbi:hypothetical protein [Tautonia marina]|uniref:hypothetical protein n=1 Tax=Tautonia marina TaxID=2653855 RepID=UPI0012610116|nr:hypothetical protein [Tautonia marina]
MPASETDRPLSAADEALLLAFLAFGKRPDDDPAWHRLSESWRSRLDEALPTLAYRFPPASARDRLANDHAAEAHPDLFRIHPSWWVRALRKESPSIRQAVIAYAPDPVGPALRRAFADAPDPEVVATYPPDPEALDWVLTLAGERFVGGPIRRDDDPPIVRVIAALDARGYARILTALGLAKLAYAEQYDAVRARDRTRLQTLRASLPAPRLELVDLAVAELAALRVEARDNPVHNLPARLGLGSLGRLLTEVEPHRARWALQHLPYHIARDLHKFMKPEMFPLPSADLMDWEAALLRAAIVLLAREGRIDPLILAEPS